MVEKSQTGFWPSVYEPMRHFGQRVADWIAPASDASLSGSAYRISIELPGVAEKDIDVSVHDGVVTVKGEKTQEREEQGDTWFFSERQYGAFSRTFRLPADADGERVEAQLKDGVLNLSVPKRSSASGEARKIAVKKG